MQPFYFGSTLLLFYAYNTLVPFKYMQGVWSFRVRFSMICFIQGTRLLIGLPCYF